MADSRPIQVDARYKLPTAKQPLWDKDAIPGSPESFPPAFWLIGAHGGAGVSTLEKVWTPAGDAHRCWPVHDTHTGCVIVARSTCMGLLAAAQTALGADPGCKVLGVVVVADAPGRIPRPLVHQLEVLRESDAIPAVWTIDYIPGLRLSTTDELAVWCPGDKQLDKRHKLSPKEAVPRQLVEIGSAIFATARQAEKTPSPITE